MISQNERVNKGMQNQALCIGEQSREVKDDDDGKS